jgi:O-antigen/teichoic acid export membrane protein
MSNKKILFGISFSWLRFVFGFLITFIQTPLFFKYLPREEVGVWFLFYSASAFLQMSDFGLPSAVSRAVAYIKDVAVKSEQPEVEFYKKYSIKDIYRSAFTSFIIISSIVVIIGTFFIMLLRPGFGVTQTPSSEISTAFAIFLVGVFFNMTANIPNACLDGLGDVGYDSLLRIIIQTSGLVAIWFLLPYYPTIKTLALIYLAQGIFSTFIVHWFLRYKHKLLFNVKGKLDLSLIKHLYQESIYLFINQIGGWLTNQSGIWIATFVLGVSQIADYSVQVQLLFYGLSISMSIPAAINPYATSAFATGGVKSLHKFFFLTLKISTFVVGIWIVVLSVWSDSILDLWIGTGHFLGYSILIPLLINLFLEMQHSVSGGFVWNTGKWPFVPATISAGILNVLFGFIGCYYWDFAGLAFGTMLAKLFTLNWYVVFYALKRLEISILSYLKEYFYPTIAVILAIIPLSMLLNSFLLTYHVGFSFRKLPGNILWSLSIGSILTFILWSFMYYKFVFKQSEKEFIKSNVKKMWNR